MPSFLHFCQRNGERYLEIDSDSNDDYSWDEEVTPICDSSYQTFPNYNSVAGEGGGGEGEGGEEDWCSAMRFSDPVWDESIQLPAAEYRRPASRTLSSSKKCGLSLKARLHVTSAVLVLTLLGFLAMWTLPVGAGQQEAGLGAWPLDHNVTCPDHDPNLLASLKTDRTIALVCMAPMVLGVAGMLVLNVALLHGYRRCHLASVILCCVCVGVFLLYITVMPYRCAASSNTAALSFSFPFLQIILIFLVPFLQMQGKGEEEEEEEEEEPNSLFSKNLRQKSSLLNPNSCTTYYRLTLPAFAEPSM